jgi:hypothetical protein
MASIRGSQGRLRIPRQPIRRPVAEVAKEGEPARAKFLTPARRSGNRGLFGNLSRYSAGKIIEGAAI